MGAFILPSRGLQTEALEEHRDSSVRGSLVVEQRPVEIKTDRTNFGHSLEISPLGAMK